MHKVLIRQLRRLGIDPDTPSPGDRWSELLALVDRSYNEADRTRYRLERALEVSSDDSKRIGDRQKALFVCAEALLTLATDKPEEHALSAVAHTLGVRHGWIVRRGEELRVVAAHGDDGTGPERCPEGLAGSQSVPLRGRSGCHELWIPITVHEAQAGALVIRSDKPRPDWGSADFDLLATTASMVGAHWAREDARLRLEALVSSKDRFVASISHELRTPLTGVVGFARELQARWHAFSVEEARALIDLVVDQGEEVSSLVEDLLVAARSDIGHIKLYPEVLDLRQHVKAACHRLGTDRRESITFEGHAGAFGDPTRVRQIIRNLITNAVRYGGERIRVRIARESDHARVEVRDDGQGIPQEAVHRIFEPFESAHASLTQPHSVGLGLWVARTLAELMDGSLTHQREHGETVFTLTLPAARDALLSPSTNIVSSGRGAPSLGGS